MEAVASSPESSRDTLGARVYRYTVSVTNVAAANACQSDKRKNGADSALNEVAPEETDSGFGLISEPICGLGPDV